MKNLFQAVLFLLLTILFNRCDSGDNNLLPQDEVLEFQGSFNEFLSFIELISEENKQEAVDLYIENLDAVPIIEGNEVYFIYLTEKQSVSIAGDFNGWSQDVTFLTIVPGTTMRYLNLVFESNARLDYKFVADGAWLLDPLNPNRVAGGYGPNSELAMPEYVQPWEIEDLGNPVGEVVSLDILSSIMGQSYNLNVYTPPGYDPSLSYPSVYIQDGGEYLQLGSANYVLDNLIASNEIEPVIAVFISPNDRAEDYAFDNRFNYAAFFTDELVAFIDEKYSTQKQASKRAVLGASFGGNISALISYTNPAVFANMGLHSGAFWPNNSEMTEMIIYGAKKDIKVASIWGTYEGDIDYEMTIVKDYMVANGYSIHWIVLPEGHSWGLWRANIDEVLKYFFPK